MRIERNWRLRHRLYVLAVVALTVAGIVLINLTGALLEDKFDWSADFSRSSVFTLSQQTRELLAGLQEDVLLYAVFKNDARDVTVEQLLKACDRASERVHSAVLDPVDDVEALLPFTKDGAAVSSGSVIVSNAAKDSFQVLDYYDFYLVGANGITGVQGEQSVSSAIHHLKAAEAGRAIFMNAHAQTTIASVPAFATQLSASGYGLFQSTDVFSGSFASMLNPKLDLLVFLSPSEDLGDEEANALIDFVHRGGSVLAFMDYSRSVDDSQGIALVHETFGNFARVFAEAGLRLNQDLLLMPEARATLGSITRFRAKAVNGELDGVQEVILSECASIETVDGSGARALLTSPESAYAKRIEAGLDSLERAAGDEVGARCAAAWGRAGEGRIALVGTSSIVANYFNEVDNRRFAMELISALLDDAGNPVIPPVSTASGNLRIHSVAQQGALIALVTGVLPLSVLIVGGIVLHRRRRRSGRTSHD